MITFKHEIDTSSFEFAVIKTLYDKFYDHTCSRNLWNYFNSFVKHVNEIEDRDNKISEYHESTCMRACQLRSQQSNHFCKINHFVSGFLQSYFEETRY